MAGETDRLPDRDVVRWAIIETEDVLDNEEVHDVSAVGEPTQGLPQWVVHKSRDRTWKQF